ncbi:SNF2-related protein [Kiritimatiellota bacterium B12222]|nr:SNF2-related protein [Kiritimatiellota bacterium B12222]
MYPFTTAKLKEWATPDTYRRAESLVENERVRGLKSLPRRLEGMIESRPRDIVCAVRFPEGSMVPENLCPCRDNKEMGLFCHHALALCLEQLNLQNDPVRLKKLMEERKRAERIASSNEEDYLTRVPAGTKGSIAIRLCLNFPRGLRNVWWEEAVPVEIMIEHQGRREPIHNVRSDLQVSLPKQEDNLLYVLEDIAEGPVQNTLDLNPSDLANVLELMLGMRIWLDGQQGFVSPEILPSSVALDMNEDSGIFEMDLQTRLPDGFEHALPAYWVEGRYPWVLLNETLFRLEPMLPGPLHEIYRQTLRIPRADIPRFLNKELEMVKKLVPLRTEIDPTWFHLEPDRPGFRLEIRGSPASLAATLYAVYGGIEWVAGTQESVDDFVIPDPENILHYLTRNPEAEMEALNSLRTLGFGGERGDQMASIVGTSGVMTFCASGIPLLRRRGWKVDLVGRISESMEQADSLMPVVMVSEGGGNGWFDIDCSFETKEGESLKLSEIRQALSAGNAFIQKGDRTLMFDRDATQQMLEMFRDCGDVADGDGHFRLPSVQGGYVKSTLDTLDGVDVEASPMWLEKVEKQNQPAKLEVVKVSSNLKATLRPYQQEGINWLCFLEKSGFGGILADEMGLGKTLQTLAWLQLNRDDEQAKGKPALIVCPTSLVENWIEEGEKFTPDLKFINLTGSPNQRDKVWENERESADVWVTSYAVIQRDLARYVQSEISAMVLDEAQHIKNRNTHNAKAVKKVNAVNRLVLTGTPVENSVMDLWSIMDFLMPGYLSTHELFKQRFEAPIKSGGAEAVDAQMRLRKKLQPFLLRRLKKDVAKDLPPKIEKVAYCRMTKDQKMVYQELVSKSKDKLEAMVSSQGFQKSRMEVLKTLLQLRQACCHLDLLKMEGLNSKAPSGKLDMFREMIEEAVDGEHRVLVFSQFTSMLGILKNELEKMGLTYCYLDGSTKKRMDVVRRFQGDNTIPVFLISLKAGGTGLNLTGADMVIHYDPWWNPAVENQATDRAYRIGQQKNVYSLKLITRDSVEEKVLALQQRKQAVIDATLDTEAEMLKSLDWEDVQELLSI